MSSFLSILRLQAPVISMSFCSWSELPRLVLMFSSTHVAREGIILFFWVAEEQSIVFTYHDPFNHGTLHGHLPCFISCRLSLVLQGTFGCVCLLQFCFLFVSDPRVGIWIMWYLFCSFIKEFPYCSPSWLLSVFRPPKRGIEGSLFSILFPAFTNWRFLVTAILLGGRWYLTVLFIQFPKNEPYAASFHEFKNKWKSHPQCTLNAP